MRGTEAWFQNPTYPNSPIELARNGLDIHNTRSEVSKNAIFVEGKSLKMAKSKKKKETTFLVCQETGDINYVMLRKPGGEKLQLKKYSPRLRRVTLHLEKRK